MRVVLLGKGGSGKSSLAGLLCAALARRGEQVLAIDGDTVPGLAQVLGMTPTDTWHLAGTAARHEGGWQLEASPAEIVERCAETAADGVRFLQLGNADADFRQYETSRFERTDLWSAMVAFSTIARSYDQQGGWVVVDLQGGTLQVASGLAGTKGVALAVVEPFAKSVLTARRYVEMGAWPPGLQLAGVANKITGPEDEEYLATELERLGLPLWASIPADPAVQQAERAGQPLASLPEDAPAPRAVAALLDRLRDAAPADAAPTAAGAAARAGAAAPATSSS